MRGDFIKPIKKNKKNKEKQMAQIGNNRGQTQFEKLNSSKRRRIRQ